MSSFNLPNCTPFTETLPSPRDEDETSMPFGECDHQLPYLCTVIVYFFVSQSITKRYYLFLGWTTYHLGLPCCLSSWLFPMITI